MSQFLICKSQKNLSKYGLQLRDVVLNRDLYIRVIKKYMNNEDVNNIWIIDKIHDMINDLENNLENIGTISQKSEIMIFWYGSDFEELDRINSRKFLMSYLNDNINNPAIEIYLYVDLKSN